MMVYVVYCVASGKQEKVQACLVTLWLFIILCHSLYKTTLGSLCSWKPAWSLKKRPHSMCLKPFVKMCIFEVTKSFGRYANIKNKQRVLMHGHQGWNVRHGLCHIYMIYVYIWVVYSFCLFCCLFITVTTQFVALYKPCKPIPKPSTYDPPDNHPLAEIQRPILRPEPKQQICHQHANTDHFGK